MSWSKIAASRREYMERVRRKRSGRHLPIPIFFIGYSASRSPRPKASGERKIAVVDVKGICSSPWKGSAVSRRGTLSEGTTREPSRPAAPRQQRGSTGSGETTGRRELEQTKDALRREVLDKKTRATDSRTRAARERSRGSESTLDERLQFVTLEELGSRSTASS